MRLKLSAAERLVVAADFKPDLTLPPEQRLIGVLDKTLMLAEQLHDTGATLKGNSWLRALGYGVLGRLHGFGLESFADLKLDDISETLGIDGMLLSGFASRFVTAKASAGVPGLATLKAAVHQNTSLLAVSVLTTFDEATCKSVYGCGVDEAVVRLARIAEDKNAGVSGIVCSPKEASILRNGVIRDSTLVVAAGVRPALLPVEGDDQNKKRVMTEVDAIKAGVDVVVVGRPITQAKNPREAALRVLEGLATVS